MPIWEWQMLLSLCFIMFWMVGFWQIAITILLWQILLPMWQMLLPHVDCCFLGWCYCQCVGWCYCQPFMADVIAMCGWCCCHNWLLLYWLMLLPMWWLMFLPYVADGTATLYVMGWCYCPVADVIATWLECGQMLFGQMEWATGLIILVLVLCCYWEPHPTYEAGGICLCSYSGMDH